MCFISIYRDEAVFNERKIFMIHRRDKFNKDPYWIIARFGNCSKCSDSVKGKKAYYFPLTKDIFCEKCGESEAQQFQESAFDEMIYNSQLGR